MTASMRILHRALFASDPRAPHMRMDRGEIGRRLQAMVFEQRYAWGRAYRDGRLVCWRVHVTIGRDMDRLGLAPHERRYVTARFRERLDRDLHAELLALARRRGAAARRVAESLAPIVIVVDDPRHGRTRLTGRLQPPQVRGVDLADIEFTIREHAS
jgi:hypothetical protein